MICAAAVATALEGTQNADGVPSEGPYAMQHDFVAGALGMMDRRADDRSCQPERIAELVERAIETRRPRPRVLAGGGAHAIWLTGLLPDRIQAVTRGRGHRIALAAAGALLGAAALAPPAPAAALRCHGLPVTVDAHRGIVNGTPGADVIRVTGPARVYGGRGDDVICGSRFADTILAGGGDDVVLGGAGRDVIRGGAGRDRLYGEAAGDRIAGGTGRDAIVTGSGRDVVAATEEDTVSFEEYGASVLIPEEGLEEIYSSGLYVGLSRQAGGIVPVWTSFQPLQLNTVSWSDEGYSVYSSQTTIEPGAQIVMSSAQPVSLGSRWTLTPSGTWSGPQAAPAGQIQALNATTTPVTAGLAQEVTANGEGMGASPIGASALLGNMLGVLTPPATVSVFTSSDPQGLLIDGLPDGAATAGVSPGRPTATFLWTPNGFLSEQPASARSGGSTMPGLGRRGR